jgi:hypothetical protein
MTRIYLGSILKKESPNETIRTTYRVNRKEVYISFKEGMVQPSEFYIVDMIGKNIRLTPVPAYLVKNHPENTRHRKIRTYAGRSPCISLPNDLVKPDQLFRMIKSSITGVIWLLRIDSFSYADETSIPPEVLRVV